MSDTQKTTGLEVLRQQIFSYTTPAGEASIGILFTEAHIRLRRKDVRRNNGIIHKRISDINVNTAREND